MFKSSVLTPVFGPSFDPQKLRFAPQISPELAANFMETRTLQFIVSVNSYFSQFQKGIQKLSWKLDILAI